MAKSRQQYLQEQAAKLPPAQQKAALAQINAAQKSGGISKAELTKLDSQFNTVLYGQTGLGGTAGAAPWMQTTGTPAVTGPATIPDPYAAGREAERRSAFAILQDAFKTYNLESLAPVIQQFMVEGISAEEASLRLRETDAYKQRFAGNQGRIAKGLSAYTPVEYLQAEETYQNLLKANNLAGLANKSTTDKLISGAVSPMEAQDRINKVFNKIDNASQEVKNELGRYFNQYGVGDPNIQRAQVAEAILSGEDPAMKLETDIRKAQLRAGATAAGFNLAETRVQTIESLLKEAGVSDTYAAGQAGFQTLAQIEPSTQTLAERYGAPTVSASELEKEAFLGLKSERRKKLQEQEEAAFKGTAGTTQVSLAQGTAGAI
ncbi:MAG TPA: hypothetical protein PLI52_02835 [Prochlorococcaceae cyanobacterium AMR_MDS_5431]|nr:hypothetical protein [Prochlorococcaceae cyanobacterium AMR_MDS_5431]